MGCHRIVYNALHGMTPSYIAEFCRPVAATHYRSTSLFHEIVLKLTREHSLLQAKLRGIIYRYLLDLHLL